MQEDRPDGKRAAGFRHIVVLKRAAMEITREMQSDADHQIPNHNNDDPKSELTTIMAFLWAVRLDQFWRSRQLAHRGE